MVYQIGEILSIAYIKAAVLCLTWERSWYKWGSGEFVSSHATWLVEGKLHVAGQCISWNSHQLKMCILFRMLKINSREELINS
jgi:hypothetical protein